MRRFLTLLFALPTLAFATTEEWMATLTLEQKARACQRLGEQGDTDTVAALAKLLPDPQLNAYARAALERIGGKEAAKAVLAALPTTSGHPQIGVVQSAGAMQLKEARPFLTKSLEGDNEALAQASLRALGQLGFFEDVLPQLKHASQDRRDAAASACLLVPDISRMNAVLQSKVSSSYRIGATRQLLVLTGSVDKLIEALRSDDAEIRKVALLAIRVRPSEELADALHAELSTTTMKPLLVRALGDTANNKTISELAKLLPANKDEPLRRAVIETLAKLGGYEWLVDHAVDDHCAETLIASNDPRVDQVVAESLAKTTDSGKRFRFIDILGKRQSPVALPALLSAAANLSERQAALEAMEPLVGFPEVPSLITWFKASEEDLQQSAYKALAAASRRAGADQAGPLLHAEIKPEATWEMKRPWLNLLSRLGYQPSLESIPLNNISAIKLLGFWPDATPVQRLLPVARDAKLGSAAVDVLLVLSAKETDHNERLKTLKALQPSIQTLAHKRRYIAVLGTTSEARSLLESYKDDPSVKDEVRAALK